MIRVLHSEKLDSLQKALSLSILIWPVVIALPFMMIVIHQFVLGSMEDFYSRPPLIAKLIIFNAILFSPSYILLAMQRRSTTRKIISLIAYSVMLIALVPAVQLFGYYSACTIFHKCL